MKRVLLITNIPNPYRLPLFNELARQLEPHDAQLKVLFGALGYRRRQWKVDMSQCKFDYDVLTSKTFELGGNAEKTMFTYGGIFRHIKSFRPDVIIITGFSLATMKIWLRSWFDRVPYIIWSGSIEGIARSLWRKIQRIVLARRASGFIAYGTRAKEYLINLGAPAHKVFIAINTVDTQFFALNTEKLRKAGVEMDGKKHLTSVGYLIPRKQNLKILGAIRRLSEQRSDFVLDIIGDGENRQQLETYVEDSQLSDNVVFHGYKQREELPRYLARSQGFLFSTNYDIWGLVLIEAMAAGLPVIASVHAGATPDLIQEGVTGFAVDFADTETVVDKVNWVLDNPVEAKEMGKKASTFIAEHVTLERSAEGFVRAIQNVLKPKSAPVGRNHYTAGEAAEALH